MHSSRAFAQKQIVLILVAVVAITAAAWLALRPRPGVPVYDSWYFYDTATASLYVAPVLTSSPTTAPSGKEGVRAIIYTCTACGEAGTLKISYLEKTSDEARAAQEKLAAPLPPDQADALRAVARAGRLIRRESDADWVSAESPRGQAIQLDAVRACADGTSPELCSP